MLTIAIHVELCLTSMSECPSDHKNSVVHTPLRSARSWCVTGKYAKALKGSPTNHTTLLDWPLCEFFDRSRCHRVVLPGWAWCATFETFEMLRLPDACGVPKEDLHGWTLHSKVIPGHQSSIESRRKRGLIGTSSTWVCKASTQHSTARGRSSCQSAKNRLTYRRRGTELSLMAFA